MAKNPWALPDGFDNTVKKAISSLMTALKNAKRSIPPEAFEALRMGNWQAFQELMDWHGIEDDFETFKQILQAQAKSAALDFYRTGGVGSQLTFDLIDERAVYWASTRAAELVVEITDQMRLNIRNTITSSTLGDMTWQQAAEEISATLPLTDRDAQAVSKYYNRQVDRLMKKGLTEAKAKAKAATLRDNYALKLTQSRASTIARTEIASAASQGRLLGWEAGVETGMVENDSVKEWIAEPTACEICADMDGKTFPWNEEFPAGVMMPPAHPNCRCSAAILPPDFADSVFTNQAMIKSKVNNFEVEFAKHMAGKHNQDTHGHGGGVAHRIPKDKRVNENTLISSEHPYVGLSEKAQKIAQKISSNSMPVVTEEVENGWLIRTTTIEATYNSRRSKGKFPLEYTKIEVLDEDGKVAALRQRVSADTLTDYPAGDLSVFSLGKDVGAYLDFEDIPDELAGYSVISLIRTRDEFRGVGLGTAMLEFARRNSPEPIYHSTMLSVAGEEFAETTKNFAKHLAGKHDQSSHAGGRSRKPSALLGKPKKVAGQTQALVDYINSRPELSRFAGSFRTDADARAYIEATQKGYSDSLSPEEVAALKVYTSKDGPAFNRAMRAGNQTPEQIEQTQKITQAIQNSGGFPDDIVLTRGHKDPFNKEEVITDPSGVRRWQQDYLDMEVGTVFSENQITSTTSNSSDAENFATHLTYHDEALRDAVIHHIYVPKSTPALAVRKETNGYGVNEDEVLFKPNQKFRLVDKVVTGDTELMQTKRDIEAGRDYDNQRVVHVFVEAIND